MLYHIRISKHRGEETKINVEESELLQRYVNPYLDGEEIMINGRVVKQNEIKAIKITASEQSLDSLITQISNEDRSQINPYGIASPADLFRPSPRSRALDKQLNVTDKFIHRVPLKKENSSHVTLNALQNKDVYISPSRIEELKRIANASFDLSKLIRLCEEINNNWLSSNYYSVIALVRTVLHHVPSIFQLSSFDQVANNYTGGTSFKKSMLHLLNSSKNIADLHLHSQAQKNEVLPNERQVDFRTDLDFLLSEILRLTK